MNVRRLQRFSVCLYRAVRMAVLEGRLHRLPSYVRAAWKVSGALQLLPVREVGRPELLYCWFCEKWVQVWPYRRGQIDDGLVYCQKCHSLLTLPQKSSAV